MSFGHDDMRTNCVCFLFATYCHQLFKSRVKDQGSRVAIFVLGDALFLCVIFLLGEDVLSAYTNAKY